MGVKFRQLFSVLAFCCLISGTTAAYGEDPTVPETISWIAKKLNGLGAKDSNDPAPPVFYSYGAQLQGDVLYLWSQERFMNKNIGETCKLIHWNTISEYVNNACDDEKGTCLWTIQGKTQRRDINEKGKAVCFETNTNSLPAPIETGSVITMNSDSAIAPRLDKAFNHLIDTLGNREPF